ncbi:MAG: hypothetical protein NW241_10380 [Bacteroidia bacterium]|nr:hypothetical protein [Bacteroidia bacterium]
MNRLLFCIALLMLAGRVPAQRTFSLTAGTGTSLYYGDLSERYTLQTQRPLLALTGSAYLLPGVSLRLGLMQTWLGCADSLSRSGTRLTRNLHFRTPITEGSLSLMWEFFPDKRFGIRWRRHVHVSPYVMAGAGIFRFNPRAQLGSQWHRLQPLGTEGQSIQDGPPRYRLIEPCLPVGGGISVRAGRFWGLYAELGYRRLRTDYLDDVSTIYPDPAALEAAAGPVAVALSNRSGGAYLAGEKRGNPRAKDSYVAIQIGMVWYARRQ